MATSTADTNADDSGSSSGAAGELSLLSALPALALGFFVLLYRGRLVITFVLIGAFVIGLGTVGQPKSTSVHLVGVDAVVAVGAGTFTLSVVAETHVDPATVRFFRVDGENEVRLDDEHNKPTRDPSGDSITLTVRQPLLRPGLHTFKVRAYRRDQERSHVAEATLRVLACAHTKVAVTDVEYALTTTWGRHFEARSARQNAARAGSRDALDRLAAKIIRLKDGSVREGKILKQDEQEVLLEVYDGRLKAKVRIARSEIRSIEVNMSIVYVTRARASQIPHVRAWLRAWGYPQGPVLFATDETAGPIHHKANVAARLAGALAHVEIAVSGSEGGANVSLPFATHTYIFGGDEQSGAGVRPVAGWKELIDDYLPPKASSLGAGAASDG